MKSYRCVFIGGRGKTTITVQAHDASTAVKLAQRTVDAKPYRALEVWDETGLVSVAIGAMGEPSNQNAPVL